MYYIGLDVHKKTISYCVKDASGQVHQEGQIGATRYRHLLVRQMVQMKNRISGLLMETGVSHNKKRLHKVGYFRELLSANEEVQESIWPLLRLSRDTIVRMQKAEYALVSSLQRDPLLAERIKRLRTVPGVGPITALTWALEMGDVSRFRSSRQAISYCGLCGDEKSSAEKVTRTPLSKQRNKHIQRVLVEAAKLAPRQDHTLALVYEREKQKGMPIERRWPLLGKWWLICSPSIEGNATSYRSQIPGV